MSASTRATSAPGRVETTKFAVIGPQPECEPGPEEGPGAAAGPGAATAAGDAPQHQHQWPRCIFCPRPLPRNGRRVPSLIGCARLAWASRALLRTAAGAAGLDAMRGWRPWGKTSRPSWPRRGTPC